MNDQSKKTPHTGQASVSKGGQSSYGQNQEDDQFSEIDTDEGSMNERKSSKGGQASYEDTSSDTTSEKSLPEE